MHYSGTPQRAHHPMHRPTHHAAVAAGEIPADERARGKGGIIFGPLLSRVETAADALTEAVIRIGVSVFPRDAEEFPRDAEERPLKRHGFYDASSDPTTIGRMFAQPAARLIGVPTGRISGLIMADLSIKDDARGMEWFGRHRGEIPSMHVHWATNREAPR